MKSTNIITTLVIKSILAFVGVVLFALLFNSLSYNGLNLITKYRKVNVGNEQFKIPIFQIRRAARIQHSSTVHAPEEIGLEQAYEYFSDHSALFIDTRSTEDYITAHIPQAISIPLETLDYGTNILAGLSKNQRIVTYCDEEDCSQSIDLAVYLGEIGFNDVYFFFGGWDIWQSNRYPQKSGDQP